MQIQGSPISINFPHGSADNERFWYWRGVSGKKYIHSIYAADACPPLPGAVYVAVRRIGHLRTAIAVGRFSPFWDTAFSEFAGIDADEIHVHLLARDNSAANAVLGDLQAAFGETRQTVSLAA